MGISHHRCVTRGCHIAVLASGVVPLCLAAFWFAWKKDFTKHVKVTRVLHPLWLYVSVTGVVVFAMLRPYYPS